MSHKHTIIITTLAVLERSKCGDLGKDRTEKARGTKGCCILDLFQMSRL